MEPKRYAAIDIGSNAVRLLICNVYETEEEIFFKKASLIRVPVRLGLDAFFQKSISAENADLLVEAMRGFNHIMKANQVVHYKGCATSAMRDALNGPEMVKRIKEEAEIDINIINGKLEAEIVFNTHMENQFTALENFLYVDVGGGSSEVTLFMKGSTIASRSFNIGTLRVLENAVTDTTWKEMKDWLEALPKVDNLAIIGLGGNINKLFKLSLKEAGAPLTQKYLSKQYRILNSMSIDDRILDLDLNPDRADVIVPALEIYLNIMNWAGVSEVYVPKIGLSDGIVRVAYEELHQPAGKAKRKIVQKSAE